MSRMMMISRKGAEEYRAGTLAEAEASDPTHHGIVAVIPLSGFLSSWFQKDLRSLAAMLTADTDVAAVVFETDSPGGDVHGLADSAAAIAELRAAKPVVFYAQGLTASAAYRLAVEADAIVANEDGRVGSIGTILTIIDDSEAMERMGIREFSWVSDVSPDKMHDLESDEFSDKMQAMANASGLRFAQAVASRRGVTVEHVKSRFGGGDMLDADEALEAGAVDHIGLLSDAVALAMRLAGERRMSAPEAVTLHNTMSSAAAHDAVVQLSQAREGYRQKESAMLIERHAAAGLSKGMAAVRETDLSQLEQRAQAAETARDKLATERDTYKAAAETAKQSAEQSAAALATLKASVEAKEQAAAEAARVEKRDALIAAAITDGRVGPGDTNMRAKLVAYGDALGNDELKGFIEAMPKLHAAGEPPQGHGGSSEPAANMSTEDEFVAAATRLAASDFGGDFVSALKKLSEEHPDAYAAAFGN